MLENEGTISGPAAKPMKRPKRKKVQIKPLGPYYSLFTGIKDEIESTDDPEVLLALFGVLREHQNALKRFLNRIRSLIIQLLDLPVDLQTTRTFRNFVITSRPNVQLATLFVRLKEKDLDIKDLKEIDAIRLAQEHNIKVPVIRPPKVKITKK